MNKIIASVGLLFLMISLSAKANLFDFSYAFSNGSTVTGSLTGNLIGDYVQNVGNVQVFSNGVQNPGQIFAVNFNPLTTQWENNVNATVSTLASLNNFMFVNSNYPTDPSYTNFFNMLNYSKGGSQAYAMNAPASIVGFDSPINNASWSLVSHNVPVLGTYPLLLTGLGLIAFTQRRRTSRQIKAF